MIALSVNFTLYGDMSDRMTTIAAGLGPEQEIYSIDECFVGMAGVRGDRVVRGHAVRERILQCIGIPTGIGIGRTKTLAKLANHVPKAPTASRAADSETLSARIATNQSMAGRHTSNSISSDQLCTKLAVGHSGGCRASGERSRDVSAAARLGSPNFSQ